MTSPALENLRLRIELRAAAEIAVKRWRDLQRWPDRDKHGYFVQAMTDLEAALNAKPTGV